MPHKIEVMDQTPIRQKIRKIPVHKLSEVRRIIDDMLANYLIQPSNSGWLSPINLVGKADGSLRLTIDYRLLNEVTEKDAFPIPNAESQF
jgi:hypothetical protein